MYAAPEHLHPDQETPYVAAGKMPTTRARISAAGDLSNHWGIPVAAPETRKMIPTSFVLDRTKSLYFFFFQEKKLELMK